MPEEKEQISCCVCSELFTPTRSHQRKCSNLCNALIYYRREKVRTLLLKLHTPAQLAALEVFAEALTDD